MGIISVEKASHLLWLGRYSERVYTTLKYLMECHDRLIDGNGDEYIAYCDILKIPNIYKNKADFEMKYLFDEENPDSIVANLSRAVDNAIVIRDIISSTTLSYLELALNQLRQAKNGEYSYFDIQKVTDYLLAYWGCLDDYILDDDSRNLIKSGKYIERMDLYFRFKCSYDEIEKVFNHLTGRLSKIHVNFNYQALNRVHAVILAKDEQRYNDYEALACINRFFEV